MVHTTVVLKVDRMVPPSAESKDRYLVSMRGTSMVLHLVVLWVRQTDEMTVGQKEITMAAPTVRAQVVEMAPVTVDK